VNYEEKRPLMEKLDQCLLDHATAAGTKDGGPQILDVYLLQGLAETHYYLKVEHDFKPDEVAALLQFADPLVVARECWEERDPEKRFSICDLLNEIKAYDRFPLADPAGYVQDQAQMVTMVKTVLDQNMAEFHASMLQQDKNEIIAQSAKISAMQSAYEFMKNDFTFEQGDAKALLKMENPLEFVAGLWPADVNGLFDMNDLVGEAIEEKKARVPQDKQRTDEENSIPEPWRASPEEMQEILEMLMKFDMELYGEVTKGTLENIQTYGFVLRDGNLQRAEIGAIQSERESVMPTEKPSVREQLRAAAKAVSQRPFSEDRTKGGEAR